MEINEEQMRLLQQAQLLQQLQNSQQSQPERPEQGPDTNFFPTDPDYQKGDKPIVGVVGHGFVGKAVERSFVPEVERFIVDPIYNTNIDQLVDQNPSLVFICTPTPTSDSGKIDAADTIDAILKVIKLTKAGVVLKSTVTPDIIEKIVRVIDQRGDHHRFIYAPEFLTERNSEYEFSNPEFLVYGGIPASVGQLMDFFEHNTNVRMPSAGNRVQVVHPMEASFIKYAINSFLALKVTFFNQLADAVKEESNTCNPIRVLKAVSQEPRVGATHWRAPGPDGKKGFGGACFPKDIAALTRYSDCFSLLEKAVEINNEYRKEYDLDEREIAQKIDFGKNDDQEDFEVQEEQQLDLFNEDAA